MNKKRRTRLHLPLVILIAVGLYFYEKMYVQFPEPEPSVSTRVEADVMLEFPGDKYPETGQHIQDAIASGASPVCTINREMAEQNRAESLAGIPTKKGYDRDEWPMAMCSEGGKGAHIEYIAPKDNRGAGAWVGNQLEEYPDGTRVQFIVK